MVGKKYEVSLHVSLAGNLRFENVHKIASSVESEVKSILPNARVVVNTEPVGDPKKDIWKLVKDVTEEAPGSRDAHNVHIQEVDGKIYLDLHLEVAAGLTVKQAHQIADQVEKELKGADPRISGITVHLESASDIISRELTEVGAEIKSFIEDAAKRFPEIKDVRGIIISRVGEKLHAVFKCFFDSNLSMEQTHLISDKLEEIIKSAYPNISRIDIHEEPYLE
jgi:divalent metal cation (Fe/Co/Zn/Cd) transporter